MNGTKGALKQQETPKVLSRQGDRILVLERILDRTPELREKSAILKESLHLLHLRTALKTAGAHSRLMLTLHCALIGSTVEDSATGFMGEGMNSIQSGFTALMAGELDSYHPGTKAFIRTILDFMALGMVYLTSEVLGQWKERFKEYNQSFTQSSGALYRELSVLFITVSGMLDGLFNLLASAAGLPEKGRKAFIELGRLYLLMLILYVSGSEKPAKNDDLWESLQHFIGKSIPTVENSIRNAIDRKVMEKATGDPIISYLQVMKSALDNDDTQALQRAIEEIHLLMGVSKEALQKDIQKLRDVCHQIAQNIGFASNEASQTITQIIQST